MQRLEWTLISGSWRTTNEEVERDVREEARKIYQAGGGLVVGGAPGVDYIATDEWLLHDPKARRLNIYPPSSLNDYTNYLLFAATANKEIDGNKIMNVAIQIGEVFQANKKAIIEGPPMKEVYDILHMVRTGEMEAREGYDHLSEMFKPAYNLRTKRMIDERADRVSAFHVNGTGGVQDSIDYALKKGIHVDIETYSIPLEKARYRVSS